MRKNIVRFAALVYLSMVIVSVACLVIKRDALQFHQRDYNYFIEQAVRLVDPGLDKRFAMNIEGFNFLGLQGIEGAFSLVQAIHADYFRYTYAALYAIFHSVLPIYIFYALVFFFPILYVGLAARPKDRYGQYQVILFILLFSLFPATMQSVTSDLRTRMLFASAWCLVVLAVYYKRPFWEKLLAFGFLLSIREEGILLGAMVIALNYFWMAGDANRWKQAAILLLLDGLALGLFLAFMRWGGYNRVDQGVSLANFLVEQVSSRPWLSAAVFGAAALAGGIAWWKTRRFKSLFFLGLAYGAGVAMTGAQMVKSLLQWSELQSALGPVRFVDAYIYTVTDSASALVYYLILLLLVLLADFLKTKWRIGLLAGLAVLCVVLGITTLMTFPAQVAREYRAIPDARPVWQFVDSHDRYQTRVLVDYATYQAFYHYDQVLVYNRLPVWLVWPVLENRFYPQNRDLLVRQIQQGIEYAVVAKESRETIIELAGLAGVTAVDITRNDRYAILQFRPVTGRSTDE